MSPWLAHYLLTVFAPTGSTFDISASALPIATGVTVSGDIEIGTSFDLVASALPVGATVTVAGDIEAGTGLDIVADPLSLAATVTVAGDIEIGTSFDLAADPLSIAAAITVAGNIAASTSSGATAAEIWGYVMSDGHTAEENVVAIRAALDALTPAAIADYLLHTATV